LSPQGRGVGGKVSGQDEKYMARSWPSLLFRELAGVEGRKREE